MRTKERIVQDEAFSMYQEIEHAFREEAGVLLPAEQVEEVLEREKKKFQYAEILEFSPVLFVGKGIGRYVKGLLRHRQPLPFLYEFLGFMMEISVILCIYLLFRSAVSHSLIAGQDVWHVVVWAGCYLLFVRIKTWRLGKFLMTCQEFDEYFHLKENEERELFFKSENYRKDKQRLHKKAKGLCIVPAGCLLALGGACSILIWKCGGIKGIQVDLAMAFLIYVAFALLSGLHNVLYGSFFVAYSAIGGMVLGRKPKEEKEAAVLHYQSLCYAQMAASGEKNAEEFSGTMRKKLRGRMAVYRGGTFFGILIFLGLLLVCLVQMVLLQFRITAALCVFAFAAALGLFALFVAFLSANEVMKHLN